MHDFYLFPIFKLQLHLSALKLKPNSDMKKELEGFMLRLSLQWPQTQGDYD